MLLLNLSIVKSAEVAICMVTSRHDGKRSISDTAYYCGLIFYVPPGSKPGGIFCVNAAFSPSP